MHRWAAVTRVLLAIVTLSAPLLAQLVPLQPMLSQPTSGDAQTAAPPPDDKSKSEIEKEVAARRQAAMTLLELVVTGSKNLSLPQNRIVIASEALSILWGHNEPRARALVTQMIGDFAEAAARQQENPEPNSRQMLHQQWEIALRTMAQNDAELALSFMNATRTFVQLGNEEREDEEERNLRLQIAGQEAGRDPRNALRLAEKDLQTEGDLPMELINLQSQIAAKDPEAGAQLLHEIVSRVGAGDFREGNNNLNFALNLLNRQLSSPTNGAAPDDSLKTLADTVASLALSPNFPEGLLPMLPGSIDMLEQLAPGRAQALRQKIDQSTPADNPDRQEWNQFSQALASGDPNQLLAVAEQASPDARPNMYQQVAWQFANNGDLQQARQIAEKLPDPSQREQVLQQAVRQSAWNAANQGQFATARQILQEMKSEEDRAIMLAQLATNTATAKQETLAQEMLEEAGGLVANRSPGASTFNAQLQVAQGFAHVKPARAIPILERSASQLEQVLGAAVEVDAFLPFQHSFEAGELILSNSFLSNLLIRPYAEAAAELANSDLAVARILADRLTLPEARLFAELLVARVALGGSEPPVIAGVVYNGRFRSWVQ